MGNGPVFYVRVKKNKTPVYDFKKKNKKGRPIMKKTGNTLNKDDHLIVSAKYQVSKADKGDGVINADGGAKYYSLAMLGPRQLVKVKDVKKTDDPPRPIIITGIIGIYTVKKGDSLSKIAKKYYKNGDKKHYMVIYEANTHILTDPEKIFPGQELQIPKLWF